MTRLIPEHFNATGSPKRRFTTKKAAMGWLMKNNLLDKFTIYHCSFCGKWHLASIKSDGHQAF